MTNPFDFSEELAKEAYNMTASEAWIKGICVRCKKPPTFYSEDGRKEYRISALCEPCYDKIMEEPEGEE